GVAPAFRRLDAELHAGRASRAEQLLELRRKGFGRAVLVRDIGEVDVDAAARIAPDDLADLVDVARRTVRRQAHDLGFAVIDLEAEISGEGRVDQADAVGEANLGETVDAVGRGVEQG